MKASKETPQVNKITIGFLLTWFFCLIYGFLGLTALFTTSIISGLALILSCLLLLPPLTKLIREKYSLELSKGVKFLILIVLFLVYGSFVPQSQIVVSETPVNVTYKIGDKVGVGDFAYTVRTMRTAYEIEETFGAKEADGIFFVFNVSIENIANETKRLWGVGLKLVDEKGRVFENSYTDFFFEQMQPGLPKKGTIAFDVPSGTRPRLEVSGNGLFSKEVKYIELK